MIKTKTSLVALASLLVLDLAMPIAAQDSFARTDRLAAQVAAAPVMVRQQQQQQQQQRGGGNKTKAGPCFDNTNRYVDCGNGTVTDSVTGLIWLKRVDCLTSADYAAANQAAASLKDGDCSLTDGSSAGDWRLPTVDEWSATTARAVINGCTVQNGLSPTLTDDSGFQCLSVGPSSFVGVASGASGDYWSSTSIDGNPTTAKLMRLLDGGFDSDQKNFSFRVWPVRSGPR
jgi:hypothetical protein